jgi:hypothetical protein
MIEIPTKFYGVYLVLLDGETEAKVLIYNNILSNGSSGILDQIEIEFGEIDGKSFKRCANQDACIYKFKKPRGLFVKPKPKDEAEWKILWETEHLQKMYGLVGKWHNKG